MKKPGNPELNTERRQFFFECDIEHCDFEQMALDNSNHELYYFFRNNCATHVSPSYFQAAYTNFEAENIEFFLQDSFYKFQHIAINMLLPSLKQDHHTSKSSKKFFDLTRTCLLIRQRRFLIQTHRADLILPQCIIINLSIHMLNQVIFLPI